MRIINNNNNNHNNKKNKNKRVQQKNVTQYEREEGKEEIRITKQVKIKHKLQEMFIKVGAHTQ